jgi:hypothetical protein
VESSNNAKGSKIMEQSKDVELFTPPENSAVIDEDPEDVVNNTYQMSYFMASPPQQEQPITPPGAIYGFVRFYFYIKISKNMINTCVFHVQNVEQVLMSNAVTREIIAKKVGSNNLFILRADRVAIAAVLVEELMAKLGTRYFIYSKHNHLCCL